MGVPLWIWLLTGAVIAGFFIFDFYSHVKTPHEPTLKESGTWTAFYVAIALLFGLLVWGLWDQEHAMQYYTGYVTEKALSVDNLFVFALIMGAFKIPRKYQQKVLLIGIVLALIFRLIFILLGAAVIAAWSDVFYLFAIFLLFTAVKLIIDEIRDAEETDPNDMMIIKWLRKVVHVTPRYHGDKLTHREESGPKKGKLALTPLFIALIAIGLIDIMFAFDSIPAIYGITSEPFLVFTTNAFSLMVFARCTSFWMACWTAWSSCPTVWASSWASLASSCCCTHCTRTICLLLTVAKMLLCLRWAPPHRCWSSSVCLW